MTVVIERRADGEWIALRADRLPSTVWGSNLRAFLPRAGWQSLSRQTTERAGRQCEVCGMQAPAARTLDCNELWSFDAETSTQSLVGGIALCEWCHLTQHSGRAANLGRAEHVIDVLAHINRWSRQRAWRDFDESAERFRSMSRIEWDLDVSLLAGWISLAEFPDLHVPTRDRRRLGNSFNKQRPLTPVEIVGDTPAVIWDWDSRVEVIDDC
ncbi:hypothetical protein [Microbacterium aurum]|nr:hypothetical protein [Microbacterium aurum]MBM7826117.1 hypothetical protein [Microbacterium aurum]